MDSRRELSPAVEAGLDQRRVRQRLWRRLALFALFLGFILFLGLLFAPFVMDNIISPLAMVSWLFLRLFVLSISQGCYWWFFIIVGFFWIARRFVQGQPPAEDRPASTPNTAMKSADNWRYVIQVSSGYRELRREVRRDLTQMLINLYSNRQHDVSYSDVYEPLLLKQIPLPEPIYDFLFTPEPEEDKRPFLQKLREFPQQPRRIIRRWTGQEAADYRQSIDAVLTFIETALEIPHDDEPRNVSDH